MRDWERICLGILSLLVVGVRSELHGADAQAPTTAPVVWTDAEIGGAVGGPHSQQGDALVLTGSGKRDSQNDQLHFTFQHVAAGDVEIIARIESLEGDPGAAEAGIMLRSGEEATSTMALGAFQILKDGTYATSCTYRDPSTIAQMNSGGNKTLMKLPFWMKLTRVGHDFGVYRSQDGLIWSQVHNGSGGAFSPDEPIEAGLFVRSGDPIKIATARFTHLTIGKPHLEYRSSWIGNSLSKDSTGFVSNNIAALWVLPDGTCLTNTFYDEAGEASKVYRDGKVITSYRKENEVIGNSECGEGSVTSDATHVCLAVQHSVFVTDILGHKQATRPIYFSQGVWNEAKQINRISGMAIVNGLLYASDSRDNKIRVAALDAPRFYTVDNSSVNNTTETIDTAGVSGAGPMSVYQSQRECDYLPYRIAHLEPQQRYTLRFHFAEWKYEKPGQRIMHLSAGGREMFFDIIAAAGKKNRAAICDMPEVAADKDGLLSFGMNCSRESVDRHIVLCGFEVLKQDGHVAFALNCGGGAAEQFASEVNEDPKRAFAFDRPGPMVADKRGDLWIIQEGNDFPVGSTVSTKYPAAIRCFHGDGTFAGRQISDIANPTSVAYDPASDRLLVSDNGPDQNIKIYGDLTGKPAVASSFGMKGGLAAGRHPGQIVDEQAGGAARFYGPVGVGIDAKQNIYVASSFSSGTDLRAFSPDGKLLWMVNALHFVDCADFDPDSDGTQVYCPFKHYALDFSRTEPGSEWKYVGYDWDTLRFGAPGPLDRQNASSAVVRRVGPGRALMMYTSGQGNAGFVGIYRFEGEISIPAGRIKQEGQSAVVWIDRNGDGIETPDEVTTCPSAGGLQSFNVDQHGDIWLTCMAGTPMLQHFKFKGLNEHGAPIYSTGKDSVESIPFPAIGHEVSTWGQIARVAYDSDHDSMYLIGPAKKREKDSDNPIVYLARYDDWSKGNRTAHWLITLPDPATDPNFMYCPPQPYGLAFHWFAMDMAGDKIFIAELWGPVHVYDANTGKLDIILNAGPEISGGNAWVDDQMGVRAFKRKNGEYVVITENSGYRGKNNLFRWTPAEQKP